MRGAGTDRTGAGCSAGLSGRTAGGGAGTRTGRGSAGFAGTGGRCCDNKYVNSIDGTGCGADAA